MNCGHLAYLLMSLETNKYSNEYSNKEIELIKITIDDIIGYREPMKYKRNFFKPIKN
jgi:hypothetical protein